LLDPGRAGELIQDGRFKFENVVIGSNIADVDWLAADLTILDIRLRVNGNIENHRNLLPTVGTGEEVFHRLLTLDNGNGKRSTSNWGPLRIADAD
jgi:hypothetical protein